MSRPVIEEMKTWPRNLSTSQGEGMFMDLMLINHEQGGATITFQEMD